MKSKIWKWIKWTLIAFFGSSVLSVAVYRFMPVYITPLMLIRAINPQGSEQQKHAEQHWMHTWVSYDNISDWMPRAVVASEDGRFYEHNGFDFKEIEKAIDESRSGKRHRGASTITQQTAKNVFLWPGHSWLRKGLEAYFTVLIEVMWPKERIMEVYLNSIEMGAGIYGAEAAAQHYFHTTASQLTRRQCALIAVSLPAPLKRNPARPSAYMNRRATAINRYM
ncbi:MAG: monofunctional biosynthetic peptidoglycan transglycosylase [Muribaculaceae bacterium]|nr:monofunctional biosynthetic peptidoglycan transglycosylase [Muribaculaceae bacterium]